MSEIAEDRRATAAYLWPPPARGWMRVIMNVLAMGFLIAFTLAIILAMWLPAYLSSRQPTPVADRQPEEMWGMFPRGR